MTETSDATQPADPGKLDRRGRRRQETIEEILRLAIEVMSRDGVAGLSLAAVARGLGVQPPALYKYFPSLVAVYDALFRRGQEAHLAAVRAAMETAPPGMAAVRAGVEGAGRWGVANPQLAQLLFWRPIPGYEPSPEAFAPSRAMVEQFAAALRDAVAIGEVGEQAASRHGLLLLATLLTGALSQHMANEPDASYDDGSYTALIPGLVDMFVRSFEPTPASGDHPDDGQRGPTRGPAST